MRYHIRQLLRLLKIFMLCVMITNSERNTNKHHEKVTSSKGIITFAFMYDD